MSQAQRRNIEELHAPVREPTAEFGAAMRLLAETPTTSETPGVHPDELTDALIFTARKWVEREDNNQKFISELG